MLVSECEAIYSGCDLINRVYQGADMVYRRQPKIKAVGMALNYPLVIRFKVDMGGACVDDVNSCIVTQGGNTLTGTHDCSSGDVHDYLVDIGPYMTQEALTQETLTLELLDRGTVIQTVNGWTATDYFDRIIALNPQIPELVTLKSAILNYDIYFAAYLGYISDKPNVPEVEAVTKEQLKDYATIVNVGTLNGVASLRLGSANAITFKFSKSSWKEDYRLFVDDEEVVTSIENNDIIYRVTGIPPKDWVHMYHITVMDGENTVLCDYNYGVFSYAYGVLSSSSASYAGLQGLMRTMYLLSMEMQNSDALFRDDSVLDVPV